MELEGGTRNGAGTGDQKWSGDGGLEMERGRGTRNGAERGGQKWSGEGGPEMERGGTSKIE